MSIIFHYPVAYTDIVYRTVIHQIQLNISRKPLTRSCVLLFFFMFLLLNSSRTGHLRENLHNIFSLFPILCFTNPFGQLSLSNPKRQRSATFAVVFLSSSLILAITQLLSSQFSPLPPVYMALPQ